MFNSLFERIPRQNSSRSVVNVNGHRFEVDGAGNVFVDGVPVNGSKKAPISVVQNDLNLEFNRSGRINGDVTGNITVTGSNIKIVIEGDMVGNIAGDCDVRVSGDYIGNKVR
jgi:hypothetical protein